MISLPKRLLSIFIFVFIFGWSFSAYSLPTANVCIDQICFRAEVARSDSEREHGLMGRKNLADDEGMLFAYPKESFPRFWMKNTLIALDFVWVSAESRVVGVSENATPCLSQTDCPILQSEYPVQYVLEIPAGVIKRTGIKRGDRAEIKFGEIS